MSSTTKIYEEKMNNCVAHLDRELTSIRAGRANPGILDKVMVDYYGSPTPVQQVGRKQNKRNKLFPAGRRFCPGAGKYLGQEIR